MWSTEGSSPLARGLRPRHPAGTISRGIIPARAGFTSGPLGVTGPYADHPRSRGVYGPRRGPSSPARGSSPLARGLRRGEDRRRGKVRIIPARAGFTIPCFGYPKLSPDHPRSRGVYPAPAPPTGRLVGSSPLARGLQRLHVEGVRGEGIIPARAGFTKHRRHRERRVGDHPRSRGVYLIRISVERR